MKNKLSRYTFYLILMLALILPINSSPSLPTAYAATLTVNDTGDGADAVPGDGVCETAPGNSTCTLRAAIMEANALPGADTINLGSNTYTLNVGGAGDDSAATGDLDIISTGGNITIVGAGPGATIIDNTTNDRVFHIIGANVEFRDLTIQGGNINPGSGGGIYNQVGSVTLRNTVVRDNSASLNGGGIFNQFGTVNILENSQIGAAGFPNTAQRGGGIYTQYSSAQGTNVVNIDSSTVAANTASATPDGGGGIYAVDDGDLTITDSTISSNQATNGAGGGIFARNTVATPATSFTMTDTTVSNNSSASGGAGIHLQDIDSPAISGGAITGNTSSGGTGGLHVEAALNNNSISLSVTGTTIDGNTGAASGAGGVANLVTGTNSDSELILTSAVVDGNTAPLVGGVYNGTNGTLTLQTTTISNNDGTGASSNGGVFNDSGTANVTDTTISGNTATFGGGGIHSNGGTLTVTTSTINGNSVSGGGAIGGGGIAITGGTADIINSTVSGNTTTASGGGIYNDTGDIAIDSATVAFNQANSGNGGGIFNTADAGSTIDFGNTILSNNTAATGPDCANTAPGTLVSLDYNIIQDETACTITGTTTNNQNVDPQLDPLGSNGGPTDTHRLQPTSAAIDQGNCPALANDQRGLTRPVDIGTITDGPAGFCDIGAYEVQSLTDALIGDFVGDDTDGDGNQDPGESGIAGVTVNLLDPSDTLLDTTTTLADGSYSFTVANGTYRIQFVLPGGYVFSPQDQGGDDT
ncbi:MAG: hypothetical protein GYB66_06450, partial [Chloroflexi bacterium]|nr:hypothetical protein [Chloroflexota bacterium]